MTEKLTEILFMTVEMIKYMITSTVTVIYFLAYYNHIFFDGRVKLRLTTIVSEKIFS